MKIIERRIDFASDESSGSNEVIDGDEVSAGDEVEFTCSSDGTPKPSLDFTAKFTTAGADDEDSAGNKIVIKVENHHRKISLTCIATNDQGKASTSLIVTVTKCEYCE